jgi:DNA polymerase III subunit epsilon
MRRPWRAGATPEALRYRAAALDRAATPWRQAHFCVVDLELSGLARRDEIVAFGAFPVDAGRVVAGGAVAGLVRPTRPLPGASVVVHGLRTQDLADAPAGPDALAPLLAAMAGRVIVAHHAWVERSFLSRALARQGAALRGPVVDTDALARLLARLDGRPDPPRDLSDLAASLGLPAHRPHDALGDALTTAQLFVALATRLDAHRPETVASLAAARRRADLEPAV